MGRHSAPDDEDDAGGDTSSVALRERDAVEIEPDDSFRGRHSHSPAPGAAVINAAPAPARPQPAVAPSPATAPPPTADDAAPSGDAAPSEAAQDVPLDELIAAAAPEVQADTETIPPVRAEPPASAPTDTTAPFRPLRDGSLDAPSSADLSPVVAPADGVARRSPAAVASHAAQNSAADLRLVRSHPGVLVLCALAIIVPFVAEVVVLLVRGTLDAHSFAVWIWAPIVGAGVLLGAVLDLAHRHHGRVTSGG